MSKLNPRQQRFCQEYVVDLNGTQAAIRAGYSPKSAKVTASRLLAKANIQQFLSEAAKARSGDLEMDNQAIERALVRLARGELRDVCTWGPGGMIPHSSEDLPREVAMCIESISYSERSGWKIKLVSPLKALEILGRFRGMDKRPAETGNPNEQVKRRVRSIKPEMAALRDQVLADQEDDDDDGG